MNMANRAMKSNVGKQSMEFSPSKIRWGTVLPQEWYI